jgi:hypothetical protein
MNPIGIVLNDVPHYCFKVSHFSTQTRPFVAESRELRRTVHFAIFDPFSPAIVRSLTGSGMTAGIQLISSGFVSPSSSVKQYKKL